HDYEAVSYVWGSSDKSHTLKLIVDDFKQLQVLSITQSLYNVLRQIRPPSHYKRLLWIDAICINQEDNVEKSIQVNQMDRIYREAGGMIGYLCETVEYHEAKNELEVNLLMKEIDELYPEDHKGWNGLRQLFTSPWAIRTWVLQEAIWAKRFVLMAGAYEIE
ncbi:heterokaryon incompatibility, partial [Xylogone sp. PMI_703]